MKSFIEKRVISILVNLRYLRFKLLKYKENNKKICNTFDHNFKNIPLYIMSNVSLERYYFVLYDGALTLKMSKMALNAFCDKTLHIYLQYSYYLEYMHPSSRKLPLTSRPMKDHSSIYIVSSIQILTRCQSHGQAATDHWKTPTKRALYLNQPLVSQ